MIFPVFRQRAKEPIWLTVFCDLTTNLMLFFLLLYAFTRLSKQQRAQMYKALRDAGKKEKIFEQKAEYVLKKFAEDASAENLGKMVKKSGLEKYSNVEVSEKQIRLVLNTPVLFASGAAELKEGTKKILDRVSRSFLLTEDRIIIEGHTDNIPVRSGRFKSNWELSARRAVNVINYFVKKGFPPSRFIAAGYGEYFPRHSNKTPEGRMKNRRIEIVLLKGGEE